MLKIIFFQINLQDTHLTKITLTLFQLYIFESISHIFMIFFAAQISFMVYINKFQNVIFFVAKNYKTIIKYF